MNNNSASDETNDPQNSDTKMIINLQRENFQVNIRQQDRKRIFDSNRNKQAFRINQSLMIEMPSLIVDGNQIESQPNIPDNYKKLFQEIKLRLEYLFNEDQKQEMLLILRDLSQSLTYLFQNPDIVDSFQLVQYVNSLNIHLFLVMLLQDQFNEISEIQDISIQLVANLCSSPNIQQIKQMREFNFVSNIYDFLKQNIMNQGKIFVQNLDNCFFGLSNFIGNQGSQDDQNKLVELGIVTSIRDIFHCEKSENLKLVETIIWFTMNLIRSNELQSTNMTEITKLISEILQCLVIFQNDDSILENVLEILENLTKFQPLLLEEFVQKDEFLETIKNCLFHSQTQIRTRALKISGNFSYSDDQYIEYLIQSDISYRIRYCLEDVNDGNRRYAAWAIGNMAASKINSQTSKIFDIDFIKFLAYVAINDQNKNVRKETLIALMNLTYYCKTDMINILIKELNYVQILSHHFTSSNDTQINELILIALSNLLYRTNDVQLKQYIAQQLEEISMVHHIETLIFDQNTAIGQICEKLYNSLQTYLE